MDLFILSARLAVACGGYWEDDKAYEIIHALVRAWITSSIAIAKRET